MILKAKPEGYKPLIEGITLKNLAYGEKTHLIQVKLGKGAVIPEHQHPQEQTGYLLSGKLRFVYGEEEAIVLPGDSWSFSGGTIHSAEALEDTIVLECFSPLREDYLSL